MTGSIKIMAPRAGKQLLSFRDIVDPAMPEDHRLYAIGDIHGRYDLLRMIARRISADAEQGHEQTRSVVFLGDYVDRGPASRQVINFLLSDPFPGFETIFLRGNHEDFILKLLNGAAINISRAWLNCGGTEMMKSYGARHADLARAWHSAREARAMVEDLMPRDHLDFLQNLQLTHTVGDYFFAHAGVRPGVPLEEQGPEDLMWIRGSFLHSDAAHGKIIVHGHTVTAAPQRRRNRIGIDTGAFRSGILTCLALHGTRQRFIACRGRFTT